jgi:uncharacterized phage-associated protein
MKKLIIAYAILIIPVIYSCGNATSRESSNNTTPYEQFHVVFSGNPSVEEIQNLMDAIIDQYGMENTDKLKHQIASALLSMRNESAIGVTEMDIMKYMYQNPKLDKPLPNAIAEASFILEKTK